MNLLGTIGNLGKGLVNLVSGGLGDSIVNTVKDLFPDSMSQAEKVQLELQIKEAAHKQEIELMKAVTEADKEFNQRVKDLEGTANDLKTIPVIGSIIIFLRGAFRPVTSYVTMYMAFMSLSGAWKLSDKQDSLLWVMVVLTLGFYFGERAMQNVMPIIGQYFGSKKSEK